MSMIHIDLQMEILKNGKYRFTVRDEDGNILHQRITERLYIAARAIIYTGGLYSHDKTRESIEYTQNEAGLERLKGLPGWAHQDEIYNIKKRVVAILPNYQEEMIKHQERQPVYNAQNK